jgi:hypothetical protein
MAQWIAIYGSIVFVTVAIAAVVAGFKRRDVSYWMTMSFLFPPFVLLLFLMPRNTGPRTRRETMTEAEARERRQLGDHIM